MKTAVPFLAAGLSLLHTGSAFAYSGSDLSGDLHIRDTGIGGGEILLPRDSAEELFSLVRRGIDDEVFPGALVRRARGSSGAKSSSASRSSSSSSSSKAPACPLKIGRRGLYRRCPGAEDPPTPPGGEKRVTKAGPVTYDPATNEVTKHKDGNKVPAEAGLTKGEEQVAGPIVGPPATASQAKAKEKVLNKAPTAGPGMVKAEPAARNIDSGHDQKFVAGPKDQSDKTGGQDSSAIAMAGRHGASATRETAINTNNAESRAYAAAARGAPADGGQTTVPAPDTSKTIGSSDISKSNIISGKRTKRSLLQRRAAAAKTNHLVRRRLQARAALEELLERMDLEDF